MYNSDTELMFPLRVASQIRSQRGDQWQNLVDRIIDPESSLVEKAAFTLMMVRLRGCQGCSVDSFRGMRGCTTCARQTIRRYRGSDADLEGQFVQAQKEVEGHLNRS